MWERFCNWFGELWQDFLCTMNWHEWEEIRWGHNRCKNCGDVDETEIY